MFPPTGTGILCLYSYGALRRTNRKRLMVGQAGLEPAMRNAPDLQSGGVTNFPTDPYLSISITRGPSPYVHNLRVYSISEETQSELRGATPNFWPQSFDQVSRRNDYLQLSPTIQN